MKARLSPLERVVSTSLESIEAPGWISDEELPLDKDFVSEQLQQEHVPQNPTSNLDSQEANPQWLSPLEQLDPDASAIVLQHLSVQEISSLGAVSKAMYRASRQDALWQIKFKARWNYNNSFSSMDWFRAYQQAYWNTDDLWVTHWNVVHPCDGLGTGRTCIEGPKCRKFVSSNEGLTFMCPTCRYHPTFHPSAYYYPHAISNEAQAVAAATRIRLEQLQLFPDMYASVSPYSKLKAEWAFGQSATLHRQIDTSQYEANSLHFVKDLLFFQVHDDREELEDLKRLFRQDESGSVHLDESHHLPEASEVALHSWHLCHFTNPDYKRPLVWRVSIMRKDCFTVYPSEGHLMPGESQVVTFGVRPLGSLLAHATQQLNAHREGVDPFWANIYSEEAHLPPAPFLIHYHFATARQERSPNSTLDPAHPQSTPWQRSGKPDQPVRIMYLSAHVNDQYPLSEFQRHTSVPFPVGCDKKTIVYCAPQMREFYPMISERLNRISLESLDQSTQAYSYRTEGPCFSCGITWGARMEELGQAFVHGRLECSIKHQKQIESIQRVHTILITLLRNLNSSKVWTKRHHQLCFSIHDRLVELRAARWIAMSQQCILSQWEAIIDFLCLRFTPVGAKCEMRTDYFMLPWRHAGVYPNLLCTDSFFSGHSPQLDSTILTFWKAEPRYLEAFAHLAHSPGRFSLGPQEDPNHLRFLPDLSSRYSRRHRGCVTDMFFDDPVSGLQAALCVVSAPRSLMVHGIWDRVAYPGTLTRRPKLIVLPKLRKDVKILLRVENPKTLLANLRLYFELQTTLDMECLSIVENWCRGTEALDPVDFDTFPLSLRNFIRNVPPPGSGRFALCEIVQTENGRCFVQEVFLPAGHETSDGERLHPPPSHRSRVQPIHVAGVHVVRPPGPRILNLLWILSAHMGWTVDDNQGTASVYVDRRILIGAQWLSISLMAAPLFWTLLARSVRWIPATPIDYPLEALPFHVETELRYLSESECLYFAFGILAFWLILGRYIERYTSRDFLRAMLEHSPAEPDAWKRGIVSRLRSYVSVACQRKWDSTCPMFLQRAVFVPKWNRRSRDDLMKHIAFWRSTQGQVASTTFQSLSGGGFVLSDKDGVHIHLGEASRSTKILLSLLVSLASFSASSPHFFLNLLTVFSCSISLVRRCEPLIGLPLLSVS